MAKKVKSSRNSPHRTDTDTTERKRMEEIQEKDRSTHHRRLPGRMILLGLGLWVLFWILESIIGGIVFHEGDLIEQVFSSEPHVIFYRSLILCIIIGFAIYAQAIINQRKRAEEEIDKTKQMLEDITQGITDGVMLLSRDLKITWANKALLEQYSCEIEEIMGEYCYEVTHHRESPCEPPHDICPVEELKRVGKPVAVTHTHSDKSGNEFHAEVTAYPIKDEKGEIVQFVHLTRDITERKKAEEALRESEEFSRNILDSMKAGVVIIDEEKHVIVDANRVAIEMIGAPKGRIVGNVCHKFICPAQEGKCPISDLGQVVDESERVLLNTKGETIPIIKTVTPMILGGRRYLLETVTDITDRKRAEQALRETEEKFRRLVEEMNDGYCVFQGPRVAFANTRIAEMFGYTQEEVIGKTVQELLPPEIISELSKVQAKRERGETVPQQYETTLASKDGTMHPVELGTRVIDFAGKPALSVVVRDITERKQAEEAVREAERRYKAIFDNQLQMVYINDEQGLFLDANDYALERLGYTRDDLGKLSFQDILHQEDLPKAFEAVADILTEGFMEHSIELRLISKSGETIWVEAFNIPLEQGVDRYVGLGIAQDVTERKRAEQALRLSEVHYRLLAENVRDVITSTDMNLKPTYISPSFTHLLGYTVEEAMARTIEESLTPASREVAVKSMARQLSLEHDGGVKRSSLPRVELEFYHKDGSTVWVEVSVAFLRNSNGEPVGLVNLLRDATERRQAEEEIRRLNEELEQRVIERTTQLQAVNKELEAFAYSVSHDLRAPLRSIDGFSQVLLEDYAGKLDEEGKDYLQRVRSASQRMAELIDDLLNLSRLTRGEMRRKRVDLSALAQGITMELQQSQPERQVEFIITPGLVAQGDAHLLRVALENLLGNAWKFTNRRSLATIEFGYTKTNGQSAYFVRDNGVGFDMAYADKLFGAFQRLHPSNEFEGNGIGLATVQRIIHRHGGDIWAESAVEQGATFYFTL